MNNILNYLFCTLASLMMFSACEKSAPEEDFPDYDETHAATITMNRGSYAASSDSASFVLKIKSTYIWKISIPEEDTWVTCDPAAGDSSDVYTQVRFYIAANETADERTCTVTINSGKAKKKLNITQTRKERVLSPEDVDASKIYIPQEFSSMDLYRSSSTWYYGRSKQSEHFIVFWGKEYDEYGDITPTECDNETFQVDIDDLLAKAEEYYDVNINQLSFAEVGIGKSNLDKYKMMIFIFHQTEWLATGGGYDNMIGGLWINPATCHPVGSTIAHEIGHSFQYQVYCDLGGGTGFRQATGQGSGFWEQCAQWQSYQSFPAEAYNSTNFTVFTENYHRHFLHEHQRYASYWFQWHWTDLYGMSAVGEVWRESVGTDDALTAYMRIHGLTNAEFNRQVYDYAAKCATWDFSSVLQDGRTVRDYGVEYIGSLGWKSKKLSDGYYQVDSSKCPEATGFNIIKLSVPKSDRTITTDFTGMPNAAGYTNATADPNNAGWTCGYVALMNDGSRTYSDPVLIGTELTGKVEWTVPENTSKLWLVVAATPQKYMTHLWDESDVNDVHWPYKVKFTNTTLFGNIEFDGTETPHDISFTKNVSIPFDATGYTGKTVVLEDELVDLAYAFVLQPSEITSGIGTGTTSKIKFYAVEPDGTLNSTTTANGYGHWFDEDGKVCTWGTSSRLFSEFDETAFSFTIGQYPNQCTVGKTYTFRQALVYGSYQATFEFNVTITE